MTKVLPSHDYDLYCNSDWYKKTELPRQYSKWGVFEELAEKNLKQITKILYDVKNDKIGKTNVKKQDLEKLKKLIKISSDKKQLESIGIKDISFIFEEIDKLSNISNLTSILGFLMNNCVVSFIHIHPSQDEKNSQMILPHIESQGIILPDRDYYLSNNKVLLQKYANYLYKSYKILDKSIRKEDIINVIRFEKDIASIMLKKEELRIPENTYNKVTYNELCKLNKMIDWKLLLRDINLKSKFFILDNLNFFKKLDAIITKYDLHVIKIYLKLISLIAYQPYIFPTMENLHFDFFKKYLKGQNKKKPHNYKIISWCNTIMGEVVAQLYIERHFDYESKDKVKNLVDTIKETFALRLSNLMWMHETTKLKALEKLKTLNTKIGFPDKWKDYSALKIVDSSLIRNFINFCRFEWDYAISIMNKKVDKYKWEMLPHKVNAYYHPTLNEIVFPAAILQSPFFNSDSPDSMNYGGIGTVIAHEITHGFDDQGRKYDKNGNFKNWWKPSDIVRFSKLTLKLVNQFNKYEFLGKKVNGKLTLGENIADLGGLTISYYALKSKMDKNKISSDIQQNQFKSFFKAWGNIWKCLSTNKEFEYKLLTDPHAPNKLRINNPLTNMQEFYDIYDIKPGDKMYRKKKVVIW